MSRGVRDLRELICVSRLSVVESEPDSRTYDSDDEVGLLDQSLSLLDIDRFGSTVSETHINHVNPGSVLHTRTNKGRPKPINGLSRVRINGTRRDDLSLTSQPTANDAVGDFSAIGKLPEHDELQTNSCTDFNTLSAQSYDSTKIRKNKKDLDLMVQGSSVSSVFFQGRSSQKTRNPTRPIQDSRFQNGGSLKAATKKRTGLKVYTDNNFDELLTCVDDDVVMSWLEQSNLSVSELNKYCHSGDNFVQLAHFWLSSDKEMKTEVIKTEYKVLQEQLVHAFASSIESKRCDAHNLNEFLCAIFREYPEKILGANGAEVFLDYLDIVSSDKSESYRMLLSDVKCWTVIPQYAQCILSIRSFILVKIWSAVVAFIQKGVVGGGRARGERHAETVEVYGTAREISFINAQRMYQAIRCGYADVVQYLLQSGKVSPRLCDAQRKSLVFHAVLSSQPTVVRFLVTQVTYGIDVNSVADSGNSALHAAANSGSAAVVRELLGAKGVRVNVVNTQCDNATPLHLAVLHGHTEVVRLLITAGADPSLLMGCTSAVDLAKDFEHEEILSILLNDPTT